MENTNSIDTVPVASIQTTVAMPTQQPDIPLPLKKKNKLWPILGAMLLVVLVAGGVFGLMYSSRRLAEAPVPTAPQSEPAASVGDCTMDPDTGACLEMDTDAQNDQNNAEMDIGAASQCDTEVTLTIDYKYDNTGTNKEGCIAGRACRDIKNRTSVGWKADNSGPQGTRDDNDAIPLTSNGMWLKDPVVGKRSSGQIDGLGLFRLGNGKVLISHANPEVSKEAYMALTGPQRSFQAINATMTLGGDAVVKRVVNGNMGYFNSTDAPTKNGVKVGAKVDLPADNKISTPPNFTNLVSGNPSIGPCGGDELEGLVEGRKTWNHRTRICWPGDDYVVKINCTCTDKTWTPSSLPENMCEGVTEEQVSNCGTKRTVTGTKTTDECCIPTWTPGSTSEVCQGTPVIETNSCTGETRTSSTVVGTKFDESCCAVSSWSFLVPQANVCSNVLAQETSNCGTSRSVSYGTKDCSACTDSTWTNDVDPTTICTTATVPQTSNCGTKRSTVSGAKTCGDVSLSLVKKAFKDQSSNSAGTYSLTTSVDKVSKDQVFVYAFEVKNSGTKKAEEIVVKDILKGDNQDLLSLVDAESRCQYVDSTRTITCSGMSLDPNATDSYKFRVKVSNGATNGDIIKNLGVMTYKDMPTSGEIQASLSLTVSTIVGCNNGCTADTECVSGLTCDLSTNKCRRPSCADASNCNCPEAPIATRAVARVATQRAEPTTLPETGILDFPGVAAFGGGLLLAIVGILLAL